MGNWFSNMKKLDEPFYAHGLYFETVENFYQAMKPRFSKLGTRRQISGMNPYQAKKFCSAKANNFVLRLDWEDVKVGVMDFGLRKKFAIGTSWHKKLMETTDEIVEWNTWHDTFWGKCTCQKHQGKGQNMLGQLLMAIREGGK